MKELEMKLLFEIKKEIERFDTKTNILLVIASILLGMSLSWIEMLKNKLDSTITILEIFLLIFVGIYFLLLILSICLFIFTVLPRKKSKRIREIEVKNYSPLYYWDLAEMSKNEINEKLANIKDEDWINQIKINSMIASKKQKLLAKGIYLLLISIIVLFISLIFYLCI